MTTMQGRQCVPEQLGAPCLLYRHTPSVWESTPRPWGLDDRYDARYLHQTEQGLRRARSRWYLAVDHPFRRQAPPQKPKQKRKTKRVGISKDEDHTDNAEKDRQERDEERAAGRNESRSRIQAQSSRKSSDKDDDESSNEEWSLESDEEEEDLHYNEDDENLSDSNEGSVHDNKKDDPLFNPDLLSTRIVPLVHEARQHLLGPDSYVLPRSYQQYDHAYVPGKYRRSQRHGLALALPSHRRRVTRSMAIDRLNADTAYLAPVDFSSLRYCLKECDSLVSKEEKKLFKSKRRRVTYPTNVNSTESPLNYGNCLVCLPCPCDVCASDGKPVESSNGTSPRRHSWCLIHPTGELLSRVCISSLLLPNGARNSALTKRAIRYLPQKHELDVGDKILQISPCGKGTIGHDQSDPSRGLFVVRSPNYCTVVRIRTEIERKAALVAEDDSVCPGLYNIEEVARIDLRSLCRSMFRSYNPMDVTNHPHYGNLYSNPKFAILSLSSNMERNTIHHVVLRDTPVIEEHNIPCLKAISHVDFTSTHPMTLWAAAESHVRPKLMTDRYSTKPLLDHGHSLYRIDLRNNEAIFQWSPSAEELLVEGVHSISGLMTDWQKEHSVWVSSLSAGKTWEIDSRMPCRAVNSFSLAATYDDDRSLLPAVGLFGGGSILTQPVVACYDMRTEFSRPILTVDKSPGATGLHMFQRPAFRPRFQTNSLECFACPGLSSHGNEPEVSVARTSSFALPDVSEGVFTCGLTSFRTCTSEFLAPGAVESLGYGDDTGTVLCAVTMTNKGDIYSHALLECQTHEESQSKAFLGLPLGSTALGIPTAENSPQQQEGKGKLSTDPRTEAKAYGGWNLSLCLTNEFPSTSTELAPMSVMTRNECRPFTSVRLEQIPTYPAGLRSPTVPGHLSAEEKREMPKEYATAANRNLGRLRESFSHDRKSVVECDHTNSDAEFRSDMTAEVLQAAGSLWKGEEDLSNHIIVKNVKEEMEDSFKHEASF